MDNYENTFVRGPSPTYSESISENDLSATLPISTAFRFDAIDSKIESIDYCEEKTHSMNEVDPLRVRKGRNTFVFWTVVIVLLILTAANLILTLTIIGVLRLGKGIQGMELIPEVDVIKFYGTTDLDRVYAKTFGQIDGFVDVPVTITGDDGDVYVRVYRNGVLNDRIVLDKEGVLIRNTNLFEIKDPSDKSTVFTTHRPHYNIPNGVGSLRAKTLSAARVTSPIDRSMIFDSDGRISVKGSEGITADAAAILLQAEHHIAINASQGATIFEAGAGIFLDMDRIPIVSPEQGLRTGNVQFKLCICVPQGTLFRIAIPRAHNGPKISCAHFDPTDDPCLTH